MNIDLITKLAKLANNNPNENEANAAARKVCKLLAEANYQFGTTTTPPNPNQQNPRASSTYDPMQDMYDILRNMGRENFYGGQWQTPPRYREPKYRPGDAHRAQSDAERRRRDENAEREYRQSEEYKRRQRDAEMKAKMEKEEKDRKRGFDFTKEKVLKTCIKCGVTKLTAYMGQNFVCNECQWRSR